MKKIKDDILHTISNQLADIINNDYDYYNGYPIEVVDEQLFNKIEKNIPGKIYIVIKFLEATLNFGQIVFPITIQAMSEQDKLDVCYTLLFEFANKYNLKWTDDKQIGQFYNAPYVLSNFNEVFEGFRSLLYVSGTFLITKNANYLTGYFINNPIYAEDGKTILKDKEKFTITDGCYLDEQVFKNYMLEKGIIFDQSRKFVLEINKNTLDGDKIESLEDCGIIVGDEFKGTQIEINYIAGWQEIDGLTLNTVGDTSLDSQPFYSSNGFTTSRAKFASRTINVTSYLFNSDFLNKCIDVYFEKESIDKEFWIMLEFKNGKSLIKTYRLGSLSLQQTIGEMPVVSVTFAN